MSGVLSGGAQRLDFVSGSVTRLLIARHARASGAADDSVHALSPKGCAQPGCSLADGPFNAAAMVSAPRGTRQEPKVLTPEEARRLLDAARGDRLEALYSVALALGSRQGEALGLKWSDIDL